MDETLRRRLVGAALLLIVAFVLVSLLPRRPAEPVAAPDGDVVTINLREPEVVYDQAAVIGTPTDDATPDTDADGAAEEAAPELTDPTELAVAPSVTPTPRPTARPTPTPKPTPKPTPPPTPAPTTAPKPAAGVAAASSSQQWWVQIGSFSDVGNAHQVESKLKGQGLAVVVAPIATAQGTLYRVRGGPFANSGAAESAHRAIVAAGYKDARIIAP
jgi:DedD protein